MPHRHVLPLKQGMLSRPRVDSLIHKGLQQPLLIMLAGPGYGKTQAMANYLCKSDSKVLWLKLSHLDNYYFWENLTRALDREFPDISQHLKTLSLPDNPFGFDFFFRILSSKIAGEKQVIWVFDDYGEIDNPQIKEFFQMLIDVNLENFRLVLISNALARSESVAFLTNKQSFILGRDLRFSAREIEQLYLHNGMQLSERETAEIERNTEGWPLPLHMMVLQNSKPGSAAAGGELSDLTVSGMFEQRFFALYSPQQQKLLIKMAMLDFFTKDIALSIFDGDRAEIALLENHVFVSIETATGRMFFHQLYKRFLYDKKYTLSDDEQREVWQSAARHYELSGNTMEAVSCYKKSNDIGGLIGAMCAYLTKQHGLSEQGMTKDRALFLLDNLSIITPEKEEQYPVAVYLRAFIYLCVLEIDKSEELLEGLAARLGGSKNPDDLELLGDVYSILGDIHMMRNQEDFGEYYKKAAEYLPNGTKLQNRNGLHVGNQHSFSMADNKPGARERMEKAAHYSIPWANKVLCGGMSGIEHIYSAEAAYLSYDFDGAQQSAYRAIYKAEAHAQHDLVCNGYLLLARVGLIKGDFKEMTEQVRNVTEYADKYKIGMLKEISDTALGWYFAALRDYSRMPKNCLALDRFDKPVMSYGRAQLIYAKYLLGMGEYAKLIGMLEAPRGLFLSGGIWPDRITLNILLATAYFYINKHDDAMRALWTAYDMSYSNGLTTLFVEGEDNMCALIKIARKQSAYEFDPVWLTFIEREAAAFAATAAKLRAEYRKTIPLKTEKNPLTKREMDVLRALARGKTREEIAAEQYITVNTVKTFVRSICNKLNANNRTDAVTMAISKGYIDIPVFE